MPGYLTTHVLDTARGQPAAGMQVVLFRIQDGGREEIARMTTNADGRTDRPILDRDAFSTGRFELEFHAGAWMDATGIPAESPRFLDVIPIRFGMSKDDHYHVPLLISPFGYSTYRGS
ncbi:MAG: hydroxyisourate hydrolase [Paracoccus sp. (in: a-proteobacteria)]|nr:hydroxyisourate hydrolase [Paracoccus sp. (in: a-proteobacteria)]